MSTVDEQFEGSSSLSKHYTKGSHRLVEPGETLEKIRPLMARLGITRVADITGLDRIGIPVIAVHRPNSRSLSVAQGKGIDKTAAQVSGLMESIETYHAEHCELPLLLGSAREMVRRHRVIDVGGLPRLSSSTYDDDRPILWTIGHELASGERVLLPYETVHLDFRLPLPSGSGCFLMSSNGLASGNHLTEAINHALCELIERDANTLWQLKPPEVRARRRLDLDTVDSPMCRSLLQRFDDADVDVLVWETTSDIGVASFLCTLVDRLPSLRPISPVAGSGCHPHREVALCRALTEAAQGRLTDISGARDDLSGSRYEPRTADARNADLRRALREPAPRRLDRCPTVHNPTLEQDLEWVLERLGGAGLSSLVVVNLTKPELDVPVVRAVVPYLEGMAELDGYVPGPRSQREGSDL